jgi:hypothetical protein
MQALYSIRNGSAIGRRRIFNINTNGVLAKISSLPSQNDIAP